jgi:hypothetical protein
MDTNYQDNSLEDWHRLQQEEGETMGLREVILKSLADDEKKNPKRLTRLVERLNTMHTNEEPKKILLTIGELRAALEPFGEDTEIRFEVSGMSAVFGENLCAAALTISADAVFVELLPFFEPEDE